MNLHKNLFQFLNLEKKIKTQVFKTGFFLECFIAAPESCFYVHPNKKIPYPSILNDFSRFSVV